MVAIRTSAGTPVKGIGGAFAGCHGKVFAKDDRGASKGGLLPSSRHEPYWVIIDMDRRTFETYLHKDVVEVVSK